MHFLPFVLVLSPAHSGDEITVVKERSCAVSQDALAISDWVTSGRKAHQLLSLFCGIAALPLSLGS